MTAIHDNGRKCKTCLKRILTHEKITKCHLCVQFIHEKCLPTYTQEDLEYSNNENNQWTCPHCLKQFFPFNNIEDNREYLDTINNNTQFNINSDILSDLLYNPLEEMHGVGEGVLDEIDPDHNYLNEIGGRQ